MNCSFISTTRSAQFICLLLIILTSSSALAQSNLPVSPVNPTQKDCVNLSNSFHHITSELYEKNRQCMMQAPRFGIVAATGTKCDDHGYMAWTQCKPITDETCRVTNYRDEQYSICMSRAQQRERDNAESIELLRTTNNFQKNALEQYKRYDFARSYLTSPEKFTSKALAKSSKDLIHFFDPKQHRFNDELSQEAYKFAFAQSRSGTKLTASPGVSAIQGESLDKISHLYSQLFDQLDKSLGEMKALDADNGKGKGSKEGEPDSGVEF